MASHQYDAAIAAGAVLSPPFQGLPASVLRPYPAFGLVALPQVLFRLFIPCGNSRGWFFAFHGLDLSTFLPPLAPRALPRFNATTEALTSARLRSRGFLPGQISTRPHDTCPAFSLQPSPTTPFLPRVRGMWGETVAAHAAGFAIRQQARRCCKPNRVHFRLGLQVRLGRLPTPPRDDAVASGCSPVARLGMTQTFTG